MVARRSQRSGPDVLRTSSPRRNRSAAAPFPDDVVARPDAAARVRVEAILRDRGVARTHTFPIEWAELEAWSCAEVRAEATLRVVDLRGDGLVRMGIPTDVARSRSQDLGRAWSRALWAHNVQPDGIIYDSRLNGETNLATFDRALTKLVATATPRLVDCRAELATIISDLDLSIV